MRARCWSYLAGMSVLALAAAAEAGDCTQRPSCEELGYTDTADQCNGDMVKCPWDYNAVFCRKKAAVAVTGRDCEIGSIVYSDLNCYDNPPEGLTKLGVVVINDDTERKMMSFDERRDVWAEANDFCNSYSAGWMAWTLPSRSQLRKIQANITYIDDVLSLKLSSCYWSSDASSSTGGAYCTTMSNGYETYYILSSRHNVRCIADY